MPRGPLGLPRLTSIGPFVKEFDDPEDLIRDITLRSHSYRNYDPREFLYLIEDGYIDEARSELNTIEDGRFYDMLKNIHQFWWRLDEDEMETFADKNPGVVQWVEVYARTEHQSRPSEHVTV